MPVNNSSSPKGPERLGAALGMGKVGGQLGGAEHMQPIQLGADAHAGLVGVGDRGSAQRIADGLLHGLEALPRHLDGPVDTARRERDAAQLAPTARRRADRAAIGIGSDRPPAPTRSGLLHRRGNAFGKVAAVARPQPQVPRPAVLGDLAPNLQLDDLTRSGRMSTAISPRPRPHSHDPLNGTTTRSSGASTKSSVAPRCPGCPPGLRPLALR